MENHLCRHAGYHAEIIAIDSFFALKLFSRLFVNKLAIRQADSARRGGALPCRPIFAQNSTVIAIENVLVSDDVVEAKFVCDLHKCKGGCCEDGDAGAPLAKDEKKILDKIYEAVKPYMAREGIAAVESGGRYLYDSEFGWVTPTVNGTICAYGIRDEKGIIKCAIEQAYYDGKVEWKKPISCHLYPIRIVEAKHATYVNYEPRESLCDPACSLGKKLKMPVYQFLKEPIIRKFGEEFYDVLQQVAVEHYDEKKK